MKLRDLSIELQTYGEFRGRYLGKVRFQDESESSVCFTLDPELASVLLAACAENIVSVTSKAARQLQGHIEQSIAEAKQGPALNA